MELQAIHPEPTSFIWKYVFSQDHKVIAKQFLWLGLILDKKEADKKKKELDRLLEEWEVVQGEIDIL